MLLRSIARVTAWQLHRIGHWLDPDDSYHYPKLWECGATPKQRVLSIIKLKQPVPWANLLYLAQQPARETRDAVDDLMDEGLVSTSSLGLVTIDKENSDGS